MFWFWTGLILGIIIGWILEWILDWWFWRGDISEIGTVLAGSGALAGAAGFSARDKAKLDAELASLRADLDAQRELNASLEASASGSANASVDAAELSKLRGELETQQKLNADLEASISSLKSEGAEPQVVIKEVIKEVPVEVIKEVEVVKEVEVIKEVDRDIPDDLKKIKGIGKVYEGILNGGGVNTFEELAELTPERIQDIIGPENWQNIDVESWVSQAKEFAAAKGDK